MRTVSPKPDPISLLFGVYRRQILSLLLNRPEQGSHVREIARQTGVPVGSLHRELRALADGGILRRTPQDGKVCYQAARESPLFAPLAAMFGAAQDRYPAIAETPAASIGEPASAYVAEPSAPERRRRALDRLNISRRVLAAFARRHQLKKMSLFGSVTRNDFRPQSDVDVLIEFLPDRTRTVFDRVEIGDELSALFGGRKVDVVTAGVFRNPLRRANIERDLMTVYDAA